MTAYFSIIISSLNHIKYFIKNKRFMLSKIERHIIDEAASNKHGCFALMSDFNDRGPMILIPSQENPNGTQIPDYGYISKLKNRGLIEEFNSSHGNYRLSFEGFKRSTCHWDTRSEIIF